MSNAGLHPEYTNVEMGDSAMTQLTLSEYALILVFHFSQGELEDGGFWSRHCIWSTSNTRFCDFTLDSVISMMYRMKRIVNMIED